MATVWRCAFAKYVGAKGVGGQHLLIQYKECFVTRIQTFDCKNASRILEHPQISDSPALMHKIFDFQHKNTNTRIYKVVHLSRASLNIVSRIHHTCCL